MRRATVYLVAGGPGARRPSPDPCLLAALQAIGRKRPVIAYVGAASGDSVSFLRMISAWLKAAGSGPVRPVALCGRRPDLAAARATLDAADAIFVSGGDVEEGMRVLAERGMVDYLRRAAGQGQRFIGLSAGSIMLAPQWVRWRNSRDENSAELFPCLGISPVYCDTHDEDSDWEEMRALLRLLPPGTVGWGIPAGGALAVAPSGRITSIVRQVVRLVREKGGK